MRRIDGGIILSGDEKWAMARFLAFDYALLPFMRRSVLERNAGLADPEVLAAFNNALLRTGTRCTEAFMRPLIIDIASCLWETLRVGGGSGSLVVASGAHGRDERINNIEDIGNLTVKEDGDDRRSQVGWMVV